MTAFARSIQPNAEAFLANIRRQAPPRRVHFIELWVDTEVQDAVCDRFDLAAGLRQEDDPFFIQKRQIALQRFLGYDYVFTGLEGVDFPLRTLWEENQGAVRLRMVL